MGMEQELRAEIRQLRGLLDIAQRAGRVAPREPAPKAKALQLNLPDVVQYPLADFAEGRGRAVPLPETMVEIAEVIGRGNAVRLVEGTRAGGKRRWRRQLYIPSEVPEGHRIAAMVGMEAATRLGFSHGNCIVELPSCHALRKAYLADHAMRLSDGGATASEIALELGLEQKTAVTLLDAADYWRERLGASDSQNEVGDMKRSSHHQTL
jgi:hypothetical protein